MNRYLSLDILRGFMMVSIIILNNPYWGYSFEMLQHSAWDGYAMADFPFALFIFIVGFSIFLSRKRQQEQGFTRKERILKIVKRTVFMFLIGVGLNIFPLFNLDSDMSLSFIDFSTIRIFGVLQRIALSYGVVAMIVEFVKPTKRNILSIAGGVTLIYSILIALGPTLENNLSNIIDIALLGKSHIYGGYGIPFDPEGLLGVLGGAISALIGILVGILSNENQNKREFVLDLFIYGIIIVLAGSVIHLGVAINKPLWSPSYALFTAGWGMMILGLLAFFTDVKERKGGFFIYFCRVFGTNALFAFILSGVLSKIIGMIRFPVTALNEIGVEVTEYIPIKTIIFKNFLINCITPEIGSLIWALGFLLVCYLITNVLYKKRIFLKL